MKYLFALLFMLPLAMLGFSQSVVTEEEEEWTWTSYQNFENVEFVYLLADAVNIRATPDLAGQKIANLPIGTRLKLEESSAEKTTMGGIDAFWYKVSWADKVGYVWGGLLADMVKSPKSDPNLKFLIGASSFVPGTDTTMDEVMIEIRAARNGKELGCLSFEGVGSWETSMNLNISTNKGIEGINYILKVEFTDMMCAGACGDYILFYSEVNRLQMVKQLDCGFDAPMFYDERLVFPEDEGGEEGKIFYTIQGGEYGDSENEIFYEVNERYEAEWNGQQLNIKGLEKGKD